MRQASWRRDNRRVGFYREQVLPRVTDVTLGRQEYAVIRQRVAAGLAGEVLEVGFGSGLNVPYYPRAVTRVLAVGPANAGRKLAAGRLARSQVPVEFAGLDGQALPVSSASIDHVLITWTLCTIPDAEAALAEMRRVLRPGGQLHFAEHGRSPAGVRRLSSQPAGGAPCHRGRIHPDRFPHLLPQGTQADAVHLRRPGHPVCLDGRSVPRGRHRSSV
jgi:SAM-dependent methyltransferase